MGESETTSLIYYGCNLVKDLEAILPSLAENYHRDILVRKCHEIETIFSNVKERLSHGEMILNGDHHQSSRVAFLQQQPPVGAGTQEWLLINSRPSHAMELFHASQGLETMVHGIGAGDSQGPARSWGGDGTGGLSSQRHRRRKDDVDKRMIRVPAPRIGNTEIPPEDGHTWRKYGQKDILGSKFPRAYYRCTHQKLYQCPAKKQVQRLDDDPYTFEVTYRGQHACHLYSTAPSIPPGPPPLKEASQESGQRATNNSMELMICPSMEEHWEAAEKQY